MRVYNGVGAFWMPRWLRDRITAWFIRDFSESIAQDHDLDYWMRDQPRAVIDRAFRDAMLREAGSSLRKQIKAVTVFAMVRLLGGPSYRRNA